MWHLCGKGRLKLRRVAEGRGTPALSELIYYERPDVADVPKLSDFSKADVTASVDELEVI